MDEGYARLPGAGYEALHPELKTRSFRPAPTKTSHAPARARPQPHSLVAGASHTRLSLAHRSEPVEHLWSAPWLAGSGFDSCCQLGSVAPDQLLSGPGRRSLVFLWPPVTGVSGAQKHSEFTLRNVPELRFDFVHPEGGGRHFPLPLTGTFGVKPGSIGDKRLLAITRPTGELRVLNDAVRPSEIPHWRIEFCPGSELLPGVGM